ncbi:MAG: GIY-YIG nuclease family protein [Arenicella sp.]|nr:GIY-YIG nuclease family protein [Arenicella sp.]
MNQQGYVYIVGSQTKGPLYIGVTRSLAKRVAQHRVYKVLGFSKKYQLSRLVFFEPCDSIHRAIWRARQISYWQRDRKLLLIKKTNPHWNDLYCRLSDNELELVKDST